MLSKTTKIQTLTAISHFFSHNYSTIKQNQQRIKTTHLKMVIIKRDKISKFSKNINLYQEESGQRNYHVKALSDHSTRRSEETLQEALEAAIQSDKRELQKLNNKKGRPPLALSSTNSTSSLSSQSPRTLSSTISHRLIHLHRRLTKQTSFKFHSELQKIRENPRHP